MNPSPTPVKPYGSAHKRLFGWLVALVLAAFSAPLHGQDIHFSQFESSPLNLNPSNTGLFDGDYRVVLNHRNQWKSVTKPYTTYSGSFDMLLNGLSLARNRYTAGILFNSDKAGDSELGLFQAGLSFGLLRAIDKDSLHFLSGGVQVSYVRHSINYTGLAFDSQYTGDNYDPTAPNNEDFSNDAHGYVDVGAGISWLLRAHDRMQVGAGFSVQHLNRPSDAFFGNSVRLFPHLQADLHADFAITGKLDLVPAILYMSQGSFSELTGGTSVRFHINNKPGREYAFLVGGWMRQSDAIIASAGLEYNQLRVGVSYDINTSDLERASNGRGGYELSLIYIIKRVKPLGIKPPCPLY